jgi:hypothetical protein
MAYRLTTRRIGMAVFGVAAVAAAILVQARQSSAVQGAAKVRGNVPGEWRYWGGDAWSTRYSALDQINASNFRVARGRVAVERQPVRRGRVLSHDATVRERPPVHGRDHPACSRGDRSRVR